MLTAEISVDAFGIAAHALEVAHRAEGVALVGGEALGERRSYRAAARPTA